jgi:hypothetical protein
MRILIVEDEEHLADLLAEVLGREGHVANTASDGRSGQTASCSSSPRSSVPCALQGSVPCVTRRSGRFQASHPRLKRACGPSSLAPT